MTFFNASIKHAKGGEEKLLNLRHLVTSKCSGITLTEIISRQTVILSALHDSLLTNIFCNGCSILVPLEIFSLWLNHTDHLGSWEWDYINLFLKSLRKKGMVKVFAFTKSVKGISHFKVPVTLNPF